MRLIDENGDMIGVVSISEALNAAKAVDLDLVEISPNAEPPVCKILDFGKYKYEIKKKTNDAKKKQKTVELKEIKIRPNIGQNDYDVKLRNIDKFLKEGNKVKISLRFKGREITHADIGMKLFDKIKEDVFEICKIEFGPKLESNKSILMILAPK